MDRFVELGGNFLDTARVYNDWKPGGKGRSERILGEWIKSRGAQDSIVVATKGGHPDLNYPDISRVRREEISKDIELSRKALGLEKLSLFYLHRDDLSIPVSDIIDWMNEFVEKGWISYFGCSNWNAERIAEANKYADKQGLLRFSAVQNGWSIGTRFSMPYEDTNMVIMGKSLLNFHKQSKLPSVPYNSQASGYFTKFITNPDKITGTVFDTADNRQLAQKLKHLADNDPQRVMEYVMGFFLNRPFQVVPVIGARSISQLESSVMAAENAVYPMWLSE